MGLGDLRRGREEPVLPVDQVKTCCQYSNSQHEALNLALQLDMLSNQPPRRQEK